MLLIILKKKFIDKLLYNRSSLKNCLFNGLIFKVYPQTRLIAVALIHGIILWKGVEIEMYYKKAYKTF